ncbi:META domain-containing protein [Streptomyces sp. NPDC046985]|uniref:META domain-containing protein n=1 Tax=Streptomyces sp. NPDC046985 TaxID=3155377 RepID=UPI00340D45BD
MFTTVERGRSVGATAGLLLAVLFLLTACTPSAPAPGTSSSTRTASPTPQGPGGYGGLLLGARWYVQWVTVGGRTTTAPSHAAAWVDFGYDGAVKGDDGCISFDAPAHLTAATLTVGRATEGTPPARPCPAARLAFQKKLRKLFAGTLTLARRVDDLTMDLRNSRGDYVAVKLLWPKGLFGARWRLDHWIVGDSIAPPPDSEISYVFHPEGSVTVETACDDLTGRADFDGDTLSLYPLAQTTHRTCSPRRMESERALLKSDKSPRVMRYSAETRFFEAVDESQGLDYFGYAWTREPAR